MRRLSWITENFGWKLLALASAVVLWALVASEPELSTFVTAQLTYKDLPENLEISSGPVNVVTLELRGPSGALRSFGDPLGTRPTVIVDMGSVQPGERTFPIGEQTMKLPRGVHLVRASPSEARFEFELRARRGVDVVPRFQGDGSNGYVVGSFTVAPRQLTIVGPASRVARVPFVTTDRVDVSALFGTAEVRVNAFVEDPNVRFEGSPQVTVTVTMKKK